MKALLLTAPSKLEFVDFPTPAVGDDEVLVRIRACGICGSDIHGWDGSTGRRHPPLIMGHEASGEIVNTGRRVDRWRAGDRVTFDSTISCGQCRFCRTGQINLCENRRVVGVSPSEYKQHGAFAEFVAIPDRILYRLPDSLPFEQAAMIEPVSIAVHAVQRVKIAPTDTAVVVGSGIAGLTFALRASEKGSVAIVTKKSRADSNTAWAQGGIACVTSNEDSVALHVRDTIIAGDALCNEEVVRSIVSEGPERIAELVLAPWANDLPTTVPIPAYAERKR